MSGSTWFVMPGSTFSLYLMSLILSTLKAHDIMIVNDKKKIRTHFIDQLFLSNLIPWARWWEVEAGPGASMKTKQKRTANTLR